jgi:hypothetical protein
MNNSVKIAALSIASFIFTGCAVPPPLETAKDLTDQRGISFVFPSQSVVSWRSQAQFSDRLSVLDAGSYTRPDGQFTAHDLSWDLRKNSCSVDRKYVFNFSNGTTEIRQRVAYDCAIVDAGGESPISFRFTKRRTLDRFLIGGDVRNYGVFLESENALKMLMEARLPIQFEMNSEFNAESTNANLIRLVRKDYRQQGTFLTSIDGRELSFKADVFPYKNGSKIVVSARIQGAITGDTVDFSRTYESFRREIERIIKA